MTTSMYCLYVGFHYTYIDINALAQVINPFWPVTFGFKPLLGLEPLTTIRPNLPASTLTIHVCMYVCMYVCVYVCMYVCMYVCIDV